MLIFSIENPLKSILWDLKSYQKLAKQDGVKFIEVDMCMFGGTHKGQIGILTNYEWIQETLCSQVVPHKHVHYKQNDTVWFTSLVNEHSEQWYRTVTMGFKDALAKGLTFNEMKAAKQNYLEDFAGSFFRSTYVPGPRQEREEANTAAIGRLRNPNHAVARSSALRETGLCARGILEQVTRDTVFYQEVLSVVASLGTPDCKGFSPEVLGYVRTDRFGSITSFAHDPDVVVSEWLRDGCFAGIGESIIEANGIFPPTSGPSWAILAAQDWSCEDHRNYASFYTDSPIVAADEITRIEHKGFIETFTDWKQVTERCPNAVASNVTLLLKTREDGTTKVRLIIDLRRSGGNGGVELPERVVLPRLSGLTNSILDLMVSETMEVQQGESIGYDLSVVDFEDAFHMLAIRELWPFVHTKAGQFSGDFVVEGSGTVGLVSGQCCCGAPGTCVFSTIRVTNTNVCRRPGNRHTWYTGKARLAHRGSVVVLVRSRSKRIVALLCFGSVPK